MTRTFRHNIMPWMRQDRTAYTYCTHLTVGSDVTATQNLPLFKLPYSNSKVNLRHSPNPPDEKLPV